MSANQVETIKKTIKELYSIYETAVRLTYDVDDLHNNIKCQVDGLRDILQDELHTHDSDSFHDGFATLYAANRGAYIDDNLSHDIFDAIMHFNKYLANEEKKCLKTK